MNEQAKEQMQKMNAILVNRLKSNFNLPVVQDNMSPEDQEESDFHFFIYSTGGFEKVQSNQLVQEVTVRYVSQYRDDLDERTIDIISAVEGQGMYKLRRTDKDMYQINDTNEYLDGIDFIFTRNVKYGF